MCQTIRYWAPMGLAIAGLLAFQPLRAAADTTSEEQSYYRMECLDREGYVSVATFGALPEGVRSAWRAFKADPTTARYAVLSKEVEKAPNRPAASKLVWDAARRLHIAPSFMASIATRAKNPKATRYDYVRYDYLACLSRAEIKNWTPPDSDVYTAAKRKALALTPANDLESRFLLAESREFANYMKSREIGESILAKNPSLYRVRMVVAGYYATQMGGYKQGADGVWKPDPTYPARMRPDLALRHCETVVKQHPEFTPAYYLAAICAYPDRAKQEYNLRQYVARDKPEFASSRMSKDVRQWLARIEKEERERKQP